MDYLVDFVRFFHHNHVAGHVDHLHPRSKNCLQKNNSTLEVLSLFPSPLFHPKAGGKGLQFQFWTAHEGQTLSCISSELAAVAEKLLLSFGCEMSVKVHNEQTTLKADK